MVAVPHAPQRAFALGTVSHLCQTTAFMQRRRIGLAMISVTFRQRGFASAPLLYRTANKLLMLFCWSCDPLPVDGKKGSFA